MKNLLVFAVLVAAISSCITTNEPGNPAIDNQSDAYAELATDNFTSSLVNVHLQNDAGQPIAGVKVSLWSDSPLADGQVIFKGITDKNGQIEARYNLPNHLEAVILQIGYIGMPDFLIIPADQIDAIVINGFDHGFEELAANLIPGQSNPQDGTETGRYNARVAAAPIVYLSTYDNNGVPDNLEEVSDVVSSELLSFINASLPEGKPVPEAHPRYLAQDAENNLVVEELADVWMTFIHEGAGYKNVLAYYTYETGSEPQSVNDISALNVVFPNASLAWSGGDLHTGDKVHLGRFDAGTTIGFALLANGWNGSESTHGLHVVYSNNVLNPEATEANRYHSVLLYDDINDLFLVGFEDQNRDKGSDNDFNDAVFYLTANPIEAIKTDKINPIDKPVDADEDGVNDTYDEYPDNPDYAYSYAYPGENSYGSFAFEDQWPGYGDYDFNDLVADYKYIQYANASNKMVTLESEFILKAAGAGFHNALGIQLDIAPSAIASVEGIDLHRDLFALNNNGTESGQRKAVFVVTDDAHASLGSNGLINTDESMEYVSPDTITVTIQFASPQGLSAIGSAPFNPFVVINQTRGRELHLPGYFPTDRVDSDYFGQGNDGSDPDNGIYYKSKKGLPWGMNLPTSFDYPQEKTDIRKAYNHFDQWAISGGFSFMDWYLEKSGYRNTDMIYSK
ncbi:LruC domain-containing protein [Marinoscillum sp.]|uniref:LruC domain-containing protein n=1 Tax=Marinoscillum sp. TaxID=2024838 RepID=UPI003BAC177B